VKADWQLPRVDVMGVFGQEGYMQALRKCDALLHDPAELLFTWADRGRQAADS
jgi:hypothetical protein